MNFIKHFNLEGKHAVFPASSPAWLKYDGLKLQEVYTNKKAAAYGTRLHEFAKESIDLGIRQPKTKKTLCAYINDAIGYKMKTEVVLYYSDYFFGTADAISFNNNLLRIHDLKTGKTDVKMEQLEIYAALFCLEYRIKPEEIQIELRIYQNDSIIHHEPEPEEIYTIMDKIVKFNKLIEDIEQEEE